jgi:hypothetical protein
VLNNLFRQAKNRLVWTKTFVGARIKQSHENTMKLVLRIKSLMPVWYGQLWQYFYRYRNWSVAVTHKHKPIWISIVSIGVILASCLFASKLNNVLESYFSVQDRFNSFKTLLVALGSALIGATAIAFSLIMFAMQINVVRMPYDLFRKFSSDLKLLGSFAMTFVITMAITCCL